MSVDLAIIIVTWNVRDLVQTALQSLLDDLATTDLKTRIILVDSASHDDTVATVRQRFPQVEIIASDVNLGFAGGNNAGFKHLGFGIGAPIESLPRAVYLLNPDTITTRGATGTLYQALFADDQIGMAGARLSYEDGSFQHSAFAFPGLRQLWAEFFWIPGRWREGAFNGRYSQHLYQSSVPFDVDFTLGATMLVRREVVEQVGVFDPGYFMYVEEVDWAWRIRAAGWRICCVPSAHVVHLAGKSTGQARPRSVINLWESRLRLFHKHYAPWKLHIARWLIAWGMSRKLADMSRADEMSEQQALQDAYRHVRHLTRTTLPLS